MNKNPAIDSSKVSGSQAKGLGSLGGDAASCFSSRLKVAARHAGASVEDFLKQLRGFFSNSFSQNSLSQGAVGVDIGSYAVKVVRIESTKETHKILGFAVERVAEKNYREALSKAMVKAKVAPHERTVVGVAGQGVVSRYVELPMMSRSELESSMRFEIEKYVPFPLAEVASDYAVIREMKDKAKMFVLIAAAKNDLIQKKCQLAQEMNLALKAVDLDCMALANFSKELAVERRRGGCYGIMNIGKSVSSINIFDDDTPALSRDIFIGGDDITKKIAEALEMEYADAERLKCEPAVKKAELAGIWESVLNELASEIRVSLDYFEARNNKTVEKIYLTGGTSRLEGITDFLNHLLAVEMKRLGPVERLGFDEAVDRAEFEKNMDVLSIAIGLALR